MGAGSSGSVLANRLSENPSWKILLLEAGGVENVLTKIPLFAPIFQLTPFNWNYTMAKQDNICWGMIDGICAWPRGKAIGGSSVINYMIYTRGNPIDFQRWTNLGVKGWSYEDVLPYYLKSENCRLGDDCSKNFDSFNGPLNIEYPFMSPLTDTFLQAGKEMGEKIINYHSNDYMGFAKLQATLKNGRRNSISSAFLKPISFQRNNLDIVKFARVIKILIDEETKQATGVVFVFRKQTYIAKATKEVIVSAGTFNSPQLLMLSGIGPKEHLQQFNIPVIKDLPVGQTLYDHIAYNGLVFKINQTIISKYDFLLPKQLFNYLFNPQQSIYASLGGIESIAYINTQQNRTYPNVELLLVAIGSYETDNGIISTKELRIKPEIYRKVYQPLENTPCWSILPVLLHPESKGYLKLKSNNPYDPPELYGNFLTHENDLKTMLQAIRYIQKLGKTKAFQRYGSVFHDTPLPGCETFIYDSDEYWGCAIRTLTVTIHHQVGTCRMGTENDPEAVVNEDFKVFGVEKLRVVDCSVIPVTLSAHTNAPAVMMGEKAADLIKKEYNCLNELKLYRQKGTSIDNKTK